MAQDLSSGGHPVSLPKPVRTHPRAFLARAHARESFLLSRVLAPRWRAFQPKAQTGQICQDLAGLAPRRPDLDRSDRLSSQPAAGRPRRAGRPAAGSPRARARARGMRAGCVWTSGTGPGPRALALATPVGYPIFIRYPRAERARSARGRHRKRDTSARKGRGPGRGPGSFPVLSPGLRRRAARGPSVCVQHAVSARHAAGGQGVPRVYRVVYTRVVYPGCTGRHIPPREARGPPITGNNREYEARGPPITGITGNMRPAGLPKTGNNREYEARGPP